MKKFKLLIIAMLSVFSMTAIAAEKIVVINEQKAVAESNEAKLFLKKFESDKAAEKAELRALEAELKAMQERFKKDQAILSEEEKRKTNQTMQEKFEEFQFRGKQLQKEYKAAEQELLRSMLPKLNDALSALMKKNGYDLILRSQVVVSMSPKLDITDLVVEQLNSAK